MIRGVVAEFFLNICGKNISIKITKFVPHGAKNKMRNSSSLLQTWQDWMGVKLNVSDFYFSEK